MLIGAVGSSLLAGWLRSPVVTIARVPSRVAQWCCRATLWVSA